MSTTKNDMPAGAELSPYDTAEFLRTPEQIAAYLEVVFEDYGNDPAMIAKALGNAARAQGMQKIARETGLNREGLYQALSGKGNPSFDTVLKVMNAVGVELRPKAVTRRADLKAKAGRKHRTSGAVKKTRAQSSSTKARRSR
jgi:probable addiction module antidote protein